MPRGYAHYAPAARQLMCCHFHGHYAMPPLPYAASFFYFRHYATTISAPKIDFAIFIAADVTDYAFRRRYFR